MFPCKSIATFSCIHNTRVLVFCTVRSYTKYWKWC